MEECIIDNCSYLMFYIVRIVNQGTLWCRNVSLETGHPWQPMGFIVVQLVVKFILKDIMYDYTHSVLGSFITHISKWRFEIINRL